MKNQNILPLVLLDDDGIRPAGKPDECLYCKQKVGEEHKYDCVILQRKVKVSYSYEIEIEVPWSWTEDEIAFHRNESSWCCDNSLDELEELRTKLNAENSCLCSVFNCDVIEIPDMKPFRKNNKEEIVP